MTSIQTAAKKCTVDFFTGVEREGEIVGVNYFGSTLVVVTYPPVLYQGSLAPGVIRPERYAVATCRKYTLKTGRRAADTSYEVLDQEGFATRAEAGAYAALLAV